MKSENITLNFHKKNPNVTNHSPIKKLRKELLFIIIIRIEAKPVVGEKLPTEFVSENFYLFTNAKINIEIFRHKLGNFSFENPNLILINFIIVLIRNTNLYYGSLLFGFCLFIC